MARADEGMGFAIPYLNELTIGHAGKSILRGMRLLGVDMFQTTSKILPVPYYGQVSSVQCQSTVLRMYAQYLDRKRGQSGAGGKQVQDIFNDINTPQGKPDRRPSPVKNAHSNMMWWLEQNYSPLIFHKLESRDSSIAWNTITNSIDRGYPLIASVSHSRVAGHINIIVGYMRAPAINMSFNHASSEVIIHDPYGAFHQSLNSDLHGKKRFDVGMSLLGGGEIGPGRNLVIQLGNVSRQATNDSAARRGNYEFMYPL